MNRIVFGLMAFKNVVLSKVTSRINRLKGSDEGVTAVEYALIIGVVALVIVVGFSELGTAILNRVRAVVTSIG